MNNWRKVLAALSNDKLRIIFAEMVLEDARNRGLAVPPGKRPKAMEQLAQSGLVLNDNGWVLNSGIFRSLLQEHDDGPRRKGIQRFLVDGRIDQYPANQRQRYELLKWVAADALKPGEELSEKDVNERLKEYAKDYVTLRRYLVDAELMERTRAGTLYSLVVDTDETQ